MTGNIGERSGILKLAIKRWPCAHRPTLLLVAGGRFAWLESCPFAGNQSAESASVAGLVPSFSPGFACRPPLLKVPRGADGDLPFTDAFVGVCGQSARSSAETHAPVKQQRKRIRADSSSG